MTIYIDLILIANFLLDYSLIAYTGIINMQKKRFIRLLLASLFAVTGLGLFFIKIEILFFVFRFFYSLGIIYIAFSYSSFKQFSKNLFIFYFLNYVTAGILVSLDFNFTDKILIVSLNSTTTWYLLIISFIFANLLTYIYKVIEENNNFYKDKIYSCCFRFLNQNYYAKGFFDTGNRAESLGDKTPIVFVDKSLIREKITEEFLISKEVPFTYVLVNTISDKKMLLAFKPESFYIIDKKNKYKKDVYVVLFENMPDLNNQFQIILHYKLIDKMGGV